MDWFSELEKSVKRINKEYSPELAIRLIADRGIDRLLKCIVIEFNHNQTEVITKKYFNEQIVEGLKSAEFIDIARVVSTYDEFNLGLVTLELVEKSIDKIEPFSDKILIMIDKVVSLVCIQRR